MQKILIGLLALTTAMLALVCLGQHRQLRATEEKMRLAEQTRNAVADAHSAQVARISELERNEARLERQVEEFTRVTSALRSNEVRQASNITTLAQRMRASRPNGDSGDGDSGLLSKGMGEMLAKMMKDPNTREMMREQQKAAINMMYSGLFKDLNLTPDEKEQFKALLTDIQMRNIESAQGLFGTGDKTASSVDIAKQIAEAKGKTDADIRALLGDERFAIYEDYQKNMGERMQLDQFRTQVATESAPLEDDQAAQLMQIMKEEKAAAPPVIPTDQTQLPRKEMFTTENFERQLQWMEDYNRRVLARAQTVLSPDQFKQYQSFQDQQASMQKLGLNMARQMFGGEKADRSPDAPVSK
jgi:hypothetical protein